MFPLGSEGGEHMPAAKRSPRVGDNGHHLPDRGLNFERE
jgi:hypothetical protein